LIEVVELLWALPQREFQYLAMELIKKRIKYMDENFIRFLEELVIVKSWWDTIDFIAANLISVHFQKYPDLIIPVVSRWMDSGNIWLQRSCVLFQLKYKGKTDLKLLYKLIDRLNDSKEFFIQKAIGWILREYSKTNPDEVKEYVVNHELKPLSKREALKIINRKISF
jgi:3-methyladenine DNA glycosylase AlkD